MRLLVCATLLCYWGAWAFTAQPSSTRHVSPIGSSTQMFLLHRHPDMILTGQAYFQLEEMEDRETCTTELFLKSDHSITVGQTNGPPFKSASGTWNFLKADEDDELELTLLRTYETGRSKVAFTDVGKFTFTVERRLVGRITQVGAVTAVEGTIHDVVEKQRFSTTTDRILGYFNMIDTTNARSALNMDESTNSRVPLSAASSVGYY